ncbi:MAG: hypothetical protein Q9209_002765 [Squamulea sp. 1 TL-2023]
MDPNNGLQSVQRKIVMAVDFGTTFSGLAWAQTRKPEIQQAIIQWPDATSGGLEGMTSEKVPTEIQYDQEGYKWGFQIEEFGQRHQWFKLGLDPSQSPGTSGLAARYTDPKAAPPGYWYGPEKLTTDYLTALRCHADRILRHQLPQSALASTPIEFVITVPALWSDRAQTLTRRCAEQAGMGTGSALHVISEPEAGAIYALDAMDPHNIKVGDTFVLCDAGGGTVDLISYKVSALKPALQIAEVTPGSGSLCGSTFLNRRFQEFLNDKFGGDEGYDEDVIEEAMKRFEITVKRSFNGNPNNRYQIPGSDVRTIFEPVIEEVIALVNGQINATKAQVKAVLLVGGFGQNVYLRDSIRQAVASKGIEVMQSPNGWTAIVRGALVKALMSTNTNFTAVKISGRSARKSYGGDIVEENKPKRLSYFQTFRADVAPPSLIKMSIYTCSDRENRGPSLYPDCRVQEVVVVTADLSQLPLHKLPRASGADGVVYFKVEFTVEITYLSAYTKYEIIHAGVNYGPVAAEYV